jgi:hypothetical protein
MIRLPRTRSLTARKKALRNKDQGRQTVPEAEPPTSPVCPAGQKRKQSAAASLPSYAKFVRLQQFYYFGSK